MAHIPLAAHASLKITVAVGTKTVVEMLGVGVLFEVECSGVGGPGDPPYGLCVTLPIT